MPLPHQLQPGTRVRVEQHIRLRERAWTNEVTGEVLSHKPENTASWFAHSNNGRLWLNRIRLKKDDGEIVVLNVDPETHVTILN